MISDKVFAIPLLPPSSFLKNSDYRTNSPYLGCSVGRVANRIRDAKFTIKDQTYTVSANVAPHTLHGGAVGFNKVIINYSTLHLWRAA